MDRIEKLANVIYDKDIVKIESDLIHNNFYTESDKRIIKLLLRNNVNTAFYSELIEAKRMAEYLIEGNPVELELYQSRYQTILKRLTEL